jgi:hypothetical protein
MIETKALKRWRKNTGLSIIIHTGLFITAITFGVLYLDREDELFLMIFFGLIIFTIMSLLISLFTWNRFIYLDKEKFWKIKKNKIIEWKIDKITSCRVVRKPFWTKIFLVEMISSDNPKPLLFETNGKIEKSILKITNDKANKDIFEKAFK